jgi:hypothetical protein
MPGPGAKEETKVRRFCRKARSGEIHAKPGLFPAFNRPAAIAANSGWPAAEALRQKPGPGLPDIRFSI